MALVVILEFKDGSKFIATAPDGLEGHLAASQLVEHHRDNLVRASINSGCPELGLSEEDRIKYRKVEDRFGIPHAL